MELATLGEAWMPEDSEFDSSRGRALIVRLPKSFLSPWVLFLLNSDYALVQMYARVRK